uniref:Probable molybdopterin-synthase adenylyltransferase n=1 Tax=Asparagopsis taxiformis TaxID=260499 RepID=A0A1C9CCB3_9FLOR|nr:molybdopterin biosynthesis protein [Asparagopsis taxiformis]AOM66038.1 molybdopterin biosynthesis protein [Asparagopsis taxiformis]
MTLNPRNYDTYLSKEEYKLFARHLSLDSIGINGQKRLKQASILFIGAGGLASSAIIYLAASGIGCIGIIDNDYITESNLHRQVLYKVNNVNQLKVVCAKKEILKINPSCQVNIYPDRLNENNAIHIFNKYDIILDASDNFPTRYIIDQVCYQLHKVHIYGAIQNFEGQISVFNYKNGITYSDLYPKSLQLNPHTCNEIGVLGILPGIIGLIQATEAIKIITGSGEILSGYLLIYNALTIDFKKIKIRSNKKTNLLISNYKFPTDSSHNLSIKDFKQYLFHNKRKILIIDVRQNIEFQLQHIQNAINIPIKQLTSYTKIPFIKKQALNKMIIIYCSDNSRSILASLILTKYQIIHYRLENGIRYLSK